MNLAFSLFATFFLSSAQAISISISNQGQSDQIKFSDSSKWDYKIKKTNNKKIELNIDGNLSNESLNALKNWKGKLLKRVTVKKTEKNNEITLYLSPGVTFFDYQTDQPSSLILDFFREKKKVIKKVVKKKESNGVSPAKKRKPASEFLKFNQNKVDQGLSLAEKKKVFDAADKDYNRLKIDDSEIDFANANSNVENDIFIKFPILINSSNQIDKLIKNSPLYFISKKKTKEGQTAELLLKLYQAESWAAFDKLFNYFFNRFPNSKYENILRSMAISAFFKAWRLTGNNKLFNKSEKNFLRLKRNLKDHGATEFWSKVIFYSYLLLKQGYKAAELGEKLISEYPDAEDIENIKLSLAEAYLTAAQYENSEKAYRKLASSSPNIEVRKHAAFAIPIIYLKKKQNEKAINKYLTENQKLGYSTDPGFYFNIAESYFWQGKYRKSADFFRNFIKKFPDHENVSYALTRIGEIMRIFGVKPEKYEPVFFESVYRFPNIKGSDLAQIRLDSLNWDVKKEKEVANNLENINKISKKYPSEEFQYFRDIIVADSFHKKGDYERSNKNLEKAFRNKPFSRLASGLKPRIIRNLKGQIDVKLDEGNYLGALEIFEKNRLSWLSTIEDTSLKKSLAMTFEQAGLVEHAIAQYLNYTSDIEESGKKVEHSVAIALARLNLKLKNYDEMDKAILRIQDLKNLPSSEKYEIVKMKSKVFADKFRFKEAKDLLNSFVNLENVNDIEKVKASIRLCDLLKGRGEYKEALDTLLKVESKLNSEAKIYIPFRKRVVDLLYTNGRVGDAVSELKKLSNHKNFYSDDSLVFFAGNTFLENGEEKIGREILSRLQKKDGIYTRMIKEKLNHKKWQNEYGQFMDRIPAMEDVQKGEL